LQFFTPTKTYLSAYGDISSPRVFAGNGCGIFRFLIFFVIVFRNITIHATVSKGVPSIAPSGARDGFRRTRESKNLEENDPL